MQFKFCPLCASELVEKEVDNESRTACSSESCRFVHYDNPTPVVAAIVEYENEVILARNATWPEGMFGLITGFLERGESLENGIAREVEEELGLSATEIEFIGNYTFDQMNQLIIAFHVKAEGLILVGEELAEIKKVAIDELVPWRFGTGHAVRDWLARRQHQAGW